MLTLYFKPTCPFSQRVLGEAEQLGVKLNLKDISGDEVLASELIEKGGKRQTPYFEDTDKGIAMYESGDIIEYLEEHHAGAKGGTTFNGLKIHNEGGEVCDTCQ